MKRIIYTLALITFCFSNAIAQGIWEKVEIITDKFNNTKESVMVHYVAGEIDAVWFEDTQMLKYIGHFPSEEAYSFTKTHADVGFRQPKERDTSADINRSGVIEEKVTIEMTFPEVTSPTFDYQFYLWVPMATEQMKKGEFIGCRYLNMAESVKYTKPISNDFNISLKGFTAAYNKSTKKK